MSRVKEALKAAKDTKALWMAPGILSQVADLFKEQFPTKHAVVIADNNTYRVAGQSVVNFLRAKGVKQQPPFIFVDANLYAEYTYVDQIIDHLNESNAIPIAVGSGTINDLTKLSAHLTGRPYMSVATAASMDGYTSFGASITADGAKQTFSCPAPKACLADIDIIRDAPPEMTAAGYADLFAKVVAGADWICADMLGIEPIDQQAWEIVQGGLLNALSDPEGIRDRRPEAITKLMEGLMLGGFAMQWTETSRPASGAEHQFSHLWNMEHHLHNGAPVSHGFQVSIATVAITALYEQMLKTPLEKLDISEACRAWPSAEASDQNAIEKFKGTDFPDIGLRETRAKYIDKEQLHKQLELLVQKWPQLKEKLEHQLIPYKKAVHMLKTVGAPVEPEQIGLSRAQLRDTFIRAQLLRRRFTALDIAVRTNNMEHWLDALFAEGK